MRWARDSDVAIVSQEPTGQNNRLGSQGPLDWWCDQKGAVPIGESRLRGKKRRTRRASAVAAYKWKSAKAAVAGASLKPYWGKPAVRNFRGGGENESMVWRPFATTAGNGRHNGSCWPKPLAPPLYSTALEKLRGLRPRCFYQAIRYLPREKSVCPDATKRNKRNQNAIR